jgi:glutamate carboxypeptidase
MTFASTTCAPAARWLPRFLLGLGAAMLACALHAQPHKEVFDRSAGYKDEALLLLERLVNIDSGSANTAGLEKVRGVGGRRGGDLGFRADRSGNGPG